eukprot:2434529-Rhodomonas_salina.1
MMMLLLLMMMMMMMMMMMLLLLSGLHARPPPRLALHARTPPSSRPRPHVTVAFFRRSKPLCYLLAFPSLCHALLALTRP